MRAYRRRRRGKAIDRFAAALRRENNWGRVAALCNAMVDRFGGLDRFCAAWVEQIDTAKRDRHGGRRVLNSFLAIVRLLESADANRPDSDVSRMTDEELEEEMGALLARMAGV
jgi:hypothetical protein